MVTRYLVIYGLRGENLNASNLGQIKKKIVMPTPLITNTKYKEYNKSILNLLPVVRNISEVSLVTQC